jgi:hypothetical protein
MPHVKDSTVWELLESLIQLALDRLCGLVVRIPGYSTEVRVLFSALPDFLRSGGSGMGST